MRTYSQFDKELPKLQAEEDYPQRIRATIRKDGFSIQAVLADATTPVVAYTIGLVESPSCSEFIVFGNDYAEVQTALNGVAKMVKEGLVIKPTSLIEGIIDRPMKFEPVDTVDGIAVCPVFRWIYPDKVSKVKFYQLHLGVPRDPHSRAAYDQFPTLGKQDVKSYRKRTSAYALVK